MSEKIKVGIVGSRDYPNRDDVTSFISNVLLEFTNEIELVSGGCEKGVDAWVSNYASAHDIPLKEFLPEFRRIPNKEYDVRDYHRRNKELAEYCDVVFAFQHKDSSGTQSTIDKCKESGTPVFVYEYKEEIEDTLRDWA